MAAVLPDSPPVFDKNDLEGTVKALCSYQRKLHDTLDFTLAQIKKRLDGQG